ncbi:hypothetical protein H2199_008543 [Coniosporium tulheliwenetii]|uniref:Uncharacterized protein n=1 Tax=Coniosporium tulheliwenetii TaxID=3383036 RepID=A0ACC2YK70_9PEZI|nr:hypothetical protein H2199_008543 [Cladosporium sp. JES 115]
MTETASLTASVYEFLEQYGHRYHRDGKDLLPIDESEQDRLDLQHHIFKMILDGELTATKIPQDVQAVLDVGTGTGIWAIEMGEEYPGATIKGLDQAPIQPSWVPPNVQFEVDDVTKPWERRPNSLDFVHVRSMAGLIKDWSAFLADAYLHLAPGGMIEVSDFTTRFQCNDGTFKQDSYCKQWEVAFHELAVSVFGMDFETAPKMAGWLEDAGFVDVQLLTKIVPVGPWPKDRNLKTIGLYHRTHMLDMGFENYSMFLFTRGGWDPIEIHSLLAHVRRELKDPRIHTYTTAKPEAKGNDD